MFISDADRKRIADAIAAAERATSGEIIAVVAAESASYLSVPFLAASVVALAVPWPLIFFTWFSVQGIYALQLAAFAAVFALALPRPIRFRLVPRSILIQRAHRRAVEQFLAQNLHTTEGRTGVLIFVSVAERYAEILADAAIHTKVNAGIWQQIVDGLTQAIGQGRAADGFIGAVEAIGRMLAEHFPPGSADRAELPNHLIVLD
ncbi:MAG TPA: TPM domain-containing protein [Hyphomicrobiaceae bacterium]|nr:TPM domain-containing protein [Hyphomicrobiaceae bacterium]